MNFKSKITWIQIISLVITLIGAIQPQFPAYAVYISLAVNVLTVILRQLQGETVKIGSRNIKL